MPTVFFPLDYLDRLTQTPPAQLEQQAFDYGLEATLHATELEVEVTAERPDLLAAEGFTRAINIYNGQPRSLPATLVDSGRSIQVTPEVLALRPYIAALIVENVSLGKAGLASLIQFQEKVTQTFGRQRKKIAIGIYDCDQIKGEILYTVATKAQLTLVPLQGTEPLTADQILATHPNGITYRETLPEGAIVPVLQDSAGQILSLPPIINAAGVGEISDTTRNLFVDVTGISQKTVLEMINILAHNFLDTGSVVKTVTIQHPEGTWITPDLNRKSVTFSAKFLNEVIGTAISKSDLGDYLQRMDLQATGTNQILVPSYRTDIFSEIDIAGDLLVAVGIDNLTTEPTAPRFHTGEANPLRRYLLQVGDRAQRLGLTEVKSFVLTDPDLLRWFSPQNHLGSGGKPPKLQNSQPSSLGLPYLQTNNAKSRSFSAVRMTLQPGLLEILSRNIHAPKPINLYEIGEVLLPQPEGSVYETFYWGFASLDPKASFATAKAYVQTLLKALKIPYYLTPCEAPQYLSGRAATVVVQGQPAGHFGEIHPQILNAFSFPEPICAGELDCQILMAA